MCRKKLSLLTLMVVWLSQLGCAYSNDRAVDGLILGGTGGALVGQAIGRNTEATIIGATVGGLLGLIVGSDIESHSYGPTPHYSNNRHHRIKKKHYSFNNYGQRCRETVTVIHRGNHNKRVVSTNCWKGRTPSHRSNKHYRYKRKHHNDRYDY